MKLKTFVVIGIVLFTVGFANAAPEGGASGPGNAVAPEESLSASDETAETAEPLPDATADEAFFRYMQTPFNQRALGREYVSTRRSVFHPAISARYSYTDNLFRSADHEQSDSIYSIIPTLRLAYPEIGLEPMQVATMSIAPGGLEMSRLAPQSNRRFQTFLQYQAEIRRHRNFSDQDTDLHNLQGKLHLASRGGMKLELVDVFSVSSEPYGTGVDSDLDEYKSNLASAQLVYDPKRKVWARITFNRFDISYDQARNEFRDRTDNEISGYLYLRIQPKTSLFLEFDYFDIAYDEATGNDGVQYHYLAGIEWDVTAKTTGLIKGGYGQRKPDDDTFDEGDEFVMEAQIDHRVTEKTSLYLRGIRKYNETDLDLAGYRLTNNLQAGVNMRLLRKLTLTCDVYYLTDKYLGSKITADGKTDWREDDLWGGNLSIGWHPRRWLTLAIGGSYGERDSNFTSFDYEEKGVSLDVTLVF